MDLKKLQELIKMVDESKLTTFELEEEGLKLVLKKETEKVFAQEIITATLPNNPMAQAQPSVGAELINPGSHTKTINSPIVGTFYASSAPGTPSFVQPGSVVKKGDTLCIIEAMKLMNEIEAEEDAQIIQVLVQDGQMVEYGQPLFSVV